MAKTKLKWPKKLKSVYLDIYGITVWLATDSETYSDIFKYLSLGEPELAGYGGQARHMANAEGDQLFVVYVKDADLGVLVH